MGNVMCFRSSGEDMGIPGFVADSNGHPITPKHGSHHENIRTYIILTPLNPTFII